MAPDGEDLVNDYSQSLIFEKRIFDAFLQNESHTRVSGFQYSRSQLDATIMRLHALIKEEADISNTKYTDEYILTIVKKILHRDKTRFSKDLYKLVV